MNGVNPVTRNVPDRTATSSSANGAVKEHQIRIVVLHEPEFDAGNGFDVRDGPGDHFSLETLKLDIWDETREELFLYCSG